MEIERGKVRTREEIMACFKDGQTIALQSALLMPATQVSQSAV